MDFASTVSGRGKNQGRKFYWGTILSLTATFFVTGCGKKLKVEPFGDYVTRFEAYSEQYSGKRIKVTDLIIEFADPGEKPANCNSALFKTPTIRVNKSLWQVVSPEVQEMVMLHELGHCVLGRKHFDEEVPTENRPRSVMASELVDSSVFEANRDQYLTELFSISPENPFPAGDRP